MLYQIYQKLMGNAVVRPNAILGCCHLLILPIELARFDLS
jgi:hypothetical protein